jgi:formylglycine-generating enzyme required for sulfatase activity
VDVRDGKLPTKTFYDTLARVGPIKKLPPSFHNPFELNSEYILIPGGRYKYQAKTEKAVPDIYFAKYLVTNKRYRRFISYLEDNEKDLGKTPPGALFCKKMLKFAAKTAKTKGCENPLGTDPTQWAKGLRSNWDSFTISGGYKATTEERHDWDDTPVVDISWFGARAYCFYLSALEEASRNVESGVKAGPYRLPREIEWEWAASGGSREWPWARDQGIPSNELANYSNHYRGWRVRATPVGRYPQGATPEGLMDMAGNVWEWMENLDEESHGWQRSLRGGSHEDGEYNLRCLSRSSCVPYSRGHDTGFRVVRSQP